MTERLDALADFKVWEGEELGENREGMPGFTGVFRAPSKHLHIAGTWGMSSMRRDGEGEIHPTVYLKQIARTIGTDTPYHVLDGVVDADVAEQWGQMLIDAAATARRDVEAL